MEFILGVLDESNVSEWGLPYFDESKEKNKVQFISDFRNLNRRLKFNPYPMPKISEILMKLEDFKYDTSLDFNVEYYPICIV